jgi:hypothetical protein
MQSHFKEKLCEAKYEDISFEILLVNKYKKMK